MRRPRRMALLSALLAIGLLGADVAPAAADPAWNLDIHHNETHFPPGGTAEYWFDVENVGDTATSGTVTVAIDLPSGLTGSFVRSLSVGGYGVPPGTGSAVWNCSGVAGASDITCTTATPIPRRSLSRSLILTVDVAPTASGDRITNATVSGGGAPEPVSATEITRIDATPPSFGIVTGSWIADFYEPDARTPVRQAGEHPDRLDVSFDLNSVAAPLAGDPHQKQAVSTPRNLKVDLPPGFVGNPTAVRECTAAQFSLAKCPASSQVGRADLAIYPIDDADIAALTAGIFNMVHPRGSVTDLAFAPLGASVHIKASLDPANGYAITTRVSDIPEALPAFYSKTTIWGVPADPAHDSERCFQFSDFYGGDTSGQCPAGIPLKPFLTVPARCSGNSEVQLVNYDSWDEPGVFGPDLVHELPGQFEGCERLRFQPSVSLIPTGSQANAPTGLDVTIAVPQSEDPNTLGNPPVKSTVVTFPEGMTFNPAFADGLDGCSLAQIGLGTNNPVACPDNSRIGEVFLTTPLLPKPLQGSMYLAKQGENPFGTTFALYMAVADTEERGVLVKIPGRIDLDPATGQITTTFDDLPQFPFDDFTLSFRSGQRAPLVTPPVCGRQTIGVKIASYAQPDEVLDASNSFTIDSGPGGSPCPAGLGGRPFDPKMAAGTLNPVAGAHSPFVFRLTREDAEQDISKVTTKLPLGLTAKLAGVETCPDSLIAQISTAEGTGAAESANPHCPLNSLVGSLNAGVGAGTNPNYFPGRVFLAGPYNGSPLSFVTVTPAIAGPYDFGSVVVRIAANIDPRTSEVTAVSDAFPQLVHGVILRVRDIRLNMTRDQFTLNPTSCEPMAVQAQILSDLGALATPSNRFQVGECGSLGFKPRLFLKLRGGTKRGAHPQLTANLRSRPGDANIRSVSVAFPRSEFLENAHIRTVCTRPDFAASACPQGAIYGKATAFTPILGYPLEANVYLRSSSNLLPDVVPDFRGPPHQPIKFESAGRVDSVRGGIRNTFDFIPDAPISRVLFRLQGGKKGLLVNSRDICAHTYRATVKFTAHNGLRHTIRPKMVALACKKAKKRKAKRSAHSRSKRMAVAQSAARDR